MVLSSGGYANLFNRLGLDMYDIRDPANPRHVGFLSMGTASALVDGNR